MHPPVQTQQPPGSRRTRAQNRSASVPCALCLRPRTIGTPRARKILVIVSAEHRQRFFSSAIVSPFR